MSAPKSPAVRRNRASTAAHDRWAREPDRVAATQAARDGRWARYLDRAREVAPAGSPPEEIERRAESLRQADMHRMALASAKARRARAGKATAGGAGPGDGTAA